MKFCVTAETDKGLKMYAAYDDVYDSLMLTEALMLGGKDQRVIFDTKKEAELSINGYQSFQRYLKNFRVEEIKP